MNTLISSWSAHRANHPRGDSKSKCLQQEEGAKARANAQAIVAKISQDLGAQLSIWRESVASQWTYAQLTIDDMTLSIGTSTGGVVSIDGNPFTPGVKVLNVAEPQVLRSIQHALSRGRKSHLH